MKKKEMATLVDGLRRLTDDLTFIADVLEGKTPQGHAGSEDAVSLPTPEPDVTDTEPEALEEKPEPEKPKYTFEQVRGILAEKSRSDHREQVKALVRKYGKEQLSDYKEIPDILEALVKDAEGL